MIPEEVRRWLGRTLPEEGVEGRDVILAWRRRLLSESPSCPGAADRRAPVQGERRIARGQAGHDAGTIAWEEHVEAWTAYARRYGDDQSAERIAERGGFGYRELLILLGRTPTTWRIYVSRP